ncbi:hypothetical protein JOF56_003583 [Kibdelosporangium banguiense]|uniref:HEXXH motif-containing protein n=1 Tax=Kibdelosporangium banguiense TaxID=1365924 RepID=A0ABS4TH63_9PSEU|nr:HEXXH motif-containing putative peptide modification protein [Kibdelosporangium banguiense]MBP2323198.1 hypothetical protein [Kibdelosporangium banguiense]
MRIHSLSTAILDEIFAGPVPEATMAKLKSTQYSLRKLRLAALVQVIASETDWEHAWQILADADEDRPDVVRDVLMHPPVGVWLVSALRSGKGLEYFDRLTEAVRTGIPGTLHRTQSQGIELDVVIDDSDPYREFGEPLQPQPLGPAELAGWRRLLDEAWDLLTERHKPYARELSAGLSAIVPISSGRRIAGASSRAAFGGVALSPKDNATALAEVLIHEMQHSKINAVLDLLPLQDGDSGRMYYAPWRSDSRPLIGTLHGIYAFASVVEFWEVERFADRTAEFTFAYRRHQVSEATANIAGAPDLTEHGRRLADAVSARMARCHESTVDPELMEIVTQITDDHRAIWELRHNERDQAAVEHMASAWLSHSTAPELPKVVRVRPGEQTMSTSVRLEMLKAKALEQDHADTDGPDAAYVRGDHDGARAGYVARIRQEPGDIHAWAGLALTTKSFVPDATFAVYQQIRARGWQAPDPVELAAWMNSELHRVGVAVGAD